MLLYLLLFIVSVLALAYFYVVHKYNYWSRRGVAGPKPSLLTFGNTMQTAGHPFPPENEVALVRQFGPVYGTYSGLMPTLTVADPEAIKLVTVKDFQYFVNRRKLQTTHEMNDISQFMAEDENWKRVRAITSPAFSSGKLRSMQPIVQKSIDKLVAYFDRLTANSITAKHSSDKCPFSGKKGGIMETKKILSGFTIDSIASTAFATETNANDDRSSENKVVKYALQWGEVPALQVLCAVTMPKWFNSLVGVHHMANVESTKFMTGLVTEMIKKRKRQTDSNVDSTLAKKRVDLMQLLLDAEVSEEMINNVGGYDQLTANMSKENFNFDAPTNSEKTSKNGQPARNRLTDNEVASQCMLFFGAGFDTTASALTHLIFELSHDQAAQERLFAELSQALDHLDTSTEQYYNAVMSNTSLPFMSACISETLRKYPPLNRLERRCSKAGYKVGGIRLEKDQLVEIPCYALHYDPQYYPEPHRFMPERFLPENAHKLVPYTYFPFGAGPRNCVGMRFALLEIKFCVSLVMRKFKFQATPKTPNVLGFNTLQFALSTTPFETFVSRR